MLSGSFMSERQDLINELTRLLQKYEAQKGMGENNYKFIKECLVKFLEQ